MKIVKASFEILDYSNLLHTIELGGRVCWKSEDKIEEGSAEPFIERLKNFKHESVLEHGTITVRLVCDRGVSHELVRHRLASYSQESTRYCNYSKGKFGEEITVIEPSSKLNASQYNIWLVAMEHAELAYFALLESGASPQVARAVLPQSLKTEVVMTANPREWRHVLKLRCNITAHPDMRSLMLEVRDEFASRWPVLFNDLED
jgi:thymidylate synthase (FAD)